MDINTVYDFVENIEPINLFYYFSISIGILFIFQFMKITLNHLLALGIAILIMFYMDKRSKRDQETKMTDLYIKLHSIKPRPKYFYMDSDIIELVDDIKEYYEYNIVAFSNMIYALDNFLEIIHDMEIGVKDHADNLEVAKHQQRIALDNLQSILFKLPVDRALEYKLERSIYYLSLFLQRHIDAMIHHNEDLIKKNGYDKNTKVYYIDHPQPIENHKIRQYINHVL